MGADRWGTRAAHPQRDPLGALLQEPGRAQQAVLAGRPVAGPHPPLGQVRLPVPAAYQPPYSMVLIPQHVVLQQQDLTPGRPYRPLQAQPGQGSRPCKHSGSLSRAAGRPLHSCAKVAMCGDLHLPAEGGCLVALLSHLLLAGA